MTSKAVADRAGVKPTLVNYYFGDRDGLLRAVVAEASAELSERLENASLHEGTVEERLTRLMDATLRGFAHEPFVARLLFEQVIFAEDSAIDRFIEQFGRSQFDAIRSVLEDGVREGRFRAVDPEIAIAAIGGVCIFFGAATPLIHRLMALDPMTPETVGSVAERSAEMILRGLAIPEHRPR
jgi:AcrR family transcriptional regulator